jgi:hypothetical protein
VSSAVVETERLLLRYGGVGENDPAIARLRARHEVLDLHTVQSELRDDVAYPMAARGRFVGALVLGPKRSGEVYARDESQAIAELAHGVATAFELLPKDGEGDLPAPGDISFQLERIYASLNRLSELLQTTFARSLPRQ